MKRRVAESKSRRVGTAGSRDSALGIQERPQCRLPVGGRFPATARLFDSATLRRRGFTIVEVLVAMVVLLIGTYAMIRVFPKGFTAIEASQMRTTATQLAEAELARWKLHPETLPDEIVATDYQGKLIPATLYGSAYANDSDPGTVGSLLLCPVKNVTLLPGSTTYRYPKVADTTFLDISQVPGAIYNPNDLTPSAFDGVMQPVPPSGTQYSRPLQAHPDWQPNSMYLPRTIIGEQADVRRLSTTGAGVPFYQLAHAPLDVLRYEQDTSKPLSTNALKKIYADVYDARPWQYVPPGDTAPADVALREREFTYDTANDLFYFGPRNVPGEAGQPLATNPRSFKVDYTGRNPDGTQSRFYGVTVNTDSLGVQIEPAKITPPPVDPRTFQVYERMIQVDDPSLLQQLGPGARRNIYYVSDQTAITGMIEFPMTLQVEPRPTDITVVKMDYRVLDWQILVFDVEVPGQTPAYGTDSYTYAMQHPEWSRVELPIRHIKGPNSINYPLQPRPQEVARGVRKFYKRNLDGSYTEVPRGPTDPATFAFVVAVDRQNGEVLTDTETTGWPVNAAERRARVKVDYANGVLTFNYNPLDPAIKTTYDPKVDQWNRSRRTYRVYCRSEDNWAVQLSMAARLYGRSASLIPGDYGVTPSAGSPTTLLTYVWGGDSRFSSDSIDARQMYFPLSEVGQVVAVDYYAKTGEFVDGEVHTIGAPRAMKVLNEWIWACPLAETLRRPPNEFGPITVRGISLRARAAWMANGRASTLSDVANAVDEWGRSTSRTCPPPAKSQNQVWHQEILTSYITRTPI